MKKILSVFFATLLTLSSILCCVACKDNKNPVEEPPEDPQTDVGEKDIPYEDTIPTLDCEKGDLRLLVSTQMAFSFLSTNSTDVVSLASHARNQAVERRFNVHLNYKALDANSTGKTAFLSAVRTAAASGDEAFEIVVPQFWAVPLMFEGCFHNLYEAENLHFERDWWYSNINESATINGKLYGVAGAFNMDKITATVATFMNKRMAEDIGIDVDGLYESVAAGNWTYEDLYRMTSLVSEDLDVNGFYDENDKFGFVSTNHGVRSLLLGFDMPASKVEDGDVTLLYMNDNDYSKFNSAFDFFNEHEANVFWTNDYDIPTDIFASQNALFYACDVVHISSAAFRELPFEYAVFPMPKYTSEQTRYVSSSMRWDLTFVMNNADLKRDAILLENLNYETAQIVIPEYWGLAVPYKYNSDPRNVDNLNTIRNTVTWDFCEYWNESVGGITFGLSNLILNGSDSAASWWGTTESLTYQGIEELTVQLKYLF